MCFEHSGDSNEFYTQFLSHTDVSCQDETGIYDFWHRKNPLNYTSVDDLKKKAKPALCIINVIVMPFLPMIDVFQ